MWALVVDELLAILAFTSYVPFFLPNSIGFAIQTALWALAYPLVGITNLLTPPLFALIGDSAVAAHAAFFSAVGVFSAAILAIQRIAKLVDEQRINPLTWFSLGMLITVVGAFADAYWHLTGLAAKEGFFTPAHGTIYSGVTIMLASTFFLKTSNRVRHILQLAGAVVAAGGAWDFWWHSTYGFVDVVAWTPPHLTVTAGFVILLVTGIARLNTGTFPRLAFRTTAALFVILWGFVVILTVL